jgi:Protein of unknown function (DUF4019)
MNGGKLRSALIVVLAVIGIGLLTVFTAASEQEDVSVIGVKWLSLLDDEKYEESWKQASSMFRDQVTLEMWLAAVNRFRKPMGTVVSRSVSRVEFTKSLRGAPDGDYAIIHFSTSFRNQSGATERLTLVKEEGKWETAAFAIH